MATTWSVLYTKSALDFFAKNVTSKRVARKIFSYRALLQEVPDLGRAYDPIYPAARPPFPCRVVSIPDTPFDLYYLKDEDNARIVVLCLEFQRVDPNARFSSLNWGSID